jgi:hypothetical protein
VQHIAIPLSLQFVAGFNMQLDFSVSRPCKEELNGIANLCWQVYNTFLVNKNSTMPVVAQAASNIVRCSLAAISISFLQQMIDKIGIGWTFTFMGALCILALCLIVADYFTGTAWRQKHVND